MIVNDMVEAAVQEIKENLFVFCAGIAEEPLSPDSAERIGRAVQQSVNAAGKAAFKAYLLAKEEPADIIRVDGEVFRFKKYSRKEFFSIWGKMSVERKLFQNASDTKSCSPMDVSWAMEGEYLSMEVREAVAFSSAHVTPEEVAGMLDKFLLESPHPTQIKRAASKIAAVMTPHREEVDCCIREQEMPPDDTQAIVVSMDGVNVLLNEPGKKCGRPAERPKGEVEKEKPTAYKNAMVGVVNYYGEVLEEGKCPERLDCIYISQMPEDRAATFKERFEAEVQDAVGKLPAEVAKVVLCDGARGIWNYIDNNAFYNGFEKLVDYWHAVEHLSLAAEALFGKESKEARAWYAKYSKKLKERKGGAASIIDSMDYYTQSLGLPKAQRAAVTAQRTFFVRNKHRMTYAEFRERRLPIGSGPVEAACKSLVKARMCRSGMRWSREGGQRILDFRTYVKSNRWEAFWAQYKKFKTAA